MDTKEMVNTNVVIAGRNYSLKIQPSDEPLIKEIVKEVNEKVQNFTTTYTKKDRQDCLAMVALSYAVDLNKAKSESSLDVTTEAELANKIHNINGILDELLRPSKA